mmetsp:Transcript_8661/g.10055  ORF Transcript_8661/g.10055 Transcript_8661/m.10055 type:complete len:106 (-) Transcript_8661:328-645(-)
MPPACGVKVPSLIKAKELGLEFKFGFGLEFDFEFEYGFEFEFKFNFSRAIKEYHESAVTYLPKKVHMKHQQIQFIVGVTSLGREADAEIEADNINKGMVALDQRC